MKNIVSIKNLIAFYEKYPDAKTSIETWVSIAKSANWQKPSDVINDFSKAKTLKNKRIVFKISKNRYRIIAQISYQRQWIFIRFIGTHAEYDKIDANIVAQY
ncbi:type II toxin-antitoxin system HigB family toxin [Cyclobacterium sp. 1_MG-2023]|uniref:type II toxin-antitoxin system HigB family toxin n=1 Tax=Cyclobacterium sp. 1_MG-2023 TaxID=3062681 RepID=UPI0026E14769|nr:type II toxin-antitoxin system HigB family toxin [Cyclobacterium sp. 1_MG-2023]MDO6435885.1 type II toxin-antitoxin system HigB family toxin [Cyclobacterium sp. 1_MG-2023]